jgi:hypothetical protein
MDLASAHHRQAGGIIGALGEDAGLSLSLLVCLDSASATNNVAANQTLPNVTASIGSELEGRYYEIRR